MEKFLIVVGIVVVIFLVLRLPKALLKGEARKNYKARRKQEAEYFQRQQQKEQAQQVIIKELFKLYQESLHAGDKVASLNAGRKYYSALHGGKWTAEDEQAISNDIAMIGSV
jgi:hypothetical protein